MPPSISEKGVLYQLESTNFIKILASSNDSKYEFETLRNFDLNRLIHQVKSPSTFLFYFIDLLSAPLILITSTSLKATMEHVGLILARQEENNRYLWVKDVLEQGL